MDKVKILMIDDDPFVQATLKAALKVEPNYEFLAAKDGQHGLNIAREHAPPVIILDLNMPVMSGEEFLEKLSLPVNSGCAIVVLTGNKGLNALNTESALKL